MQTSWRVLFSHGHVIQRPSTEAKIDPEHIYCQDLHM